MPRRPRQPSRSSRRDSPSTGRRRPWRGATVIVFTNDDDVIHNIHIFGPGADDDVDLGLQKPGKLLSYKFDKAGFYRVRCNIHPSVKMSVTVK